MILKTSHQLERVNFAISPLIPMKEKNRGDIDTRLQLTIETGTELGDLQKTVENKKRVRNKKIELSPFNITPLKRLTFSCEKSSTDYIIVGKHSRVSGGNRLNNDVKHLRPKKTNVLPTIENVMIK